MIFILRIVNGKFEKIKNQWNVILYWEYVRTNVEHGRDVTDFSAI